MRFLVCMWRFIFGTKRTHTPTLPHIHIYVYLPVFAFVVLQKRATSMAIMNALALRTKPDVWWSLTKVSNATQHKQHRFDHYSTLVLSMYNNNTEEKKQPFHRHWVLNLVRFSAGVLCSVAALVMHYSVKVPCLNFDGVYCVFSSTAILCTLTKLKFRIQHLS